MKRDRWLYVSLACVGLAMTMLFGASALPGVGIGGTGGAGAFVTFVVLAG